jgi:hypothetical protein
MMIYSIGTETADAFHLFCASAVCDDPNQYFQHHPRYCCDNVPSVLMIEMISQVMLVYLIFAQQALQLIFEAESTFP